MSRIFTLVTAVLISAALKAQTGHSTFFCKDGPEDYQWELVGPNPGPDMLQAVGLLSCVAAHPSDSNTLYVGTEHSGLWKTTNGGLSWQNISDTIQVPSLGFTEISIDPYNPEIIIAGTKTRSFGYPHWQDMSKGYGILLSQDGGLSWQSAEMKEEPNPYTYIETLKRNPHNPEHLVAAGNKDIWKSTDGGFSWELVFKNPTQLPGWFIDLEFSLDDSSQVYASTKLFGYGGTEDKGSLTGVAHAAQVFVSSKGGEKGSWQEASPPHTQYQRHFAIHVVMDVSPADPKYLYSVHALGRAHLIYKTSDGGQNWQMVDSVNNSGLVGANWSYYRHELELSDEDVSVIYAGTNTLIRSADGGKSWKSTTQYIPHGKPGASTHGDIRAILNLGYKEAGDQLLIANDGGVARSVNGGRYWANLNGQGLAITEFYGVDVFRSNADERLIAGALHNGAFVYSDSVWTPFVVGGDGDWSEIDHLSDGEKRVYTMNNGRLRMSDDQGHRFRPVPGQPENRWIQGQRFEVDPHDHHRLLYGLYNLFRFDARSNSWEKLFGKEKEDHTASEVSVAKVAPSDPNVIYLTFDGITWGKASDNYKFYRSLDGGKSWANITTKLKGSAGVMYQWAAVSDLVFDPADAKRVFVSLKNYGGPKTGEEVKDRVMYSEDGGESWSDMSMGLPPVPVNYLHYMDGSDDLIWAATDAGVYYWSAVGESWMCFNQGFPNAMVTKLEIDPCGEMMYASTWGRGIWKVPLPDFHPLREITTDETWDTGHFYNGTLRIKKGVALTITDTLYMGEKGRVEIEKGGRLIVDGGAVTVKNCGDYWQGVYHAGGGKPSKKSLQIQNGGTLLKVRP